MSRVVRVLLRSILLFGALALGGCAGAGGSAPAQPPGGPHACPDLVVDRSAPLVQPANGATGVSTTIGSVTVTSETGLAGLQITLTPSSGSPIEGGAFAAASSSTMAATIPVLSAHTTYTVSSSSLPVIGSDGSCTLGTAWTMGSFTTQ
jgi:hypothetical protein